MKRWGKEHTMKKNKLDRYKEKYKELEKENFARMNLKEGENVKHCIDNTDERFFYVGWLVTSEGRVWSLAHKRWLVPWINERGYWRVANTYVHKLVCYYFLSEDDRSILKIIEEHNKMGESEEKWTDEVHHKELVEKIDYVNMSNEERIVACMKVNNKNNLVYQIKKDHVDIHRIMNGNKTKGEEEGIEQFDCFTCIMRNSGVDSAYVSYNEDEKKVYNMTLKLKGMTLEEEEEFDKKLKNSKLLY